MTIVLFIVILGALIFVHEFGHFISAKKAGIRVDEFALGFPPKIFSKKIGETTYSINLVPFGGFVKIFGEDGIEDTDLTQTDKAGRFTSKPRWIQAAVLASGVLGNIIFAWLLISATFLSGVPSSIEGRYANEVQDAAVTITSVLSDSPAGRAGLLAGDKVLAMSDDNERLFKSTDAALARQFIAETKGKLTIEFARSAETKTAIIQPITGIVQDKIAIGVALDTIGVVKFGPIRAFFEGLLMTWDLTRAVALGLVGFIGQVFHGQADLSAITGPVGIVGLVGEARVLGLVYLLSFTAFISINLAVINLLPIPALDGGRLLFVAIEGVIRRPIPARLGRALNSAGFILLILFMILITYRDIVRLL